MYQVSLRSVRWFLRLRDKLVSQSVSEKVDFGFYIYVYSIIFIHLTYCQVNKAIYYVL